jgi:hypothetical protein
MSDDGERTKKLVAFKKKLETRIQEMDSELKEMQAMLETVNSILLEKSFKRPEIHKQPIAAEAPPSIEEATVTPKPPPTQLGEEAENVTPLKTGAGELLADLILTEDSMRVVPAADKRFDVNTPPFTQFLVERVLTRMQERDSELVKAGQLEPNKIFCYNIVREGDTIQEIVVKNFDQDRLKELRSSVRWTLEKMYEKTGSQT